MPSEGLVDLPVYIKGVGLSGLGFSDLDGLSLTCPQKTGPPKKLV